MRTAGALIDASEPYPEDSLHRASKMVNAPQVTLSTTSVGSPPHTEQSGLMRLEHLQSLPPVYISTTCDGCNTSGGATEHGPAISGEDHESPLIDEDEREVLLSQIETLLGVLVPFKATARMKSVFQEKTLDDLTKSDEEWPDVGFDESLVTSAVRKGHVGQLLRPLEENHLRIKLLLETR
ncbi:hypothetical protein BC939DRAFT_501669 [Gamsiella multidivaricata]|uniref:uncharacterized protein n=1 Tax=Gamsiella multidivaricata TaxID=101098 RepID=UPI002220B55B|nr:uncharacterized protein BC939DRAFT_501669 [Gamsiella multidivaricata]KAI7826479.1 hypothetical protein BC939DRAFT_501669 [Gamsiella multidivaricata]